MAAELALELYGVRARITASPAALLDDVRDRLLDVWKAVVTRRPASINLDLKIASLGGGTYLVEDADGELMKAPLEGALYFLETHLRHQVALMSPEKIFVHAGVVGFPDRALVIPGQSYSGKTTLVAAMVRAGASYLSDEYAVLDGAGLVYPFAKPLSIRIEGGPTRDHPVASLGGQIATGPLPVVLIVLSRYRPRAAWQPTRLSRGDAMLALLHHTAQTRDRPANTLAALKRAVDGAIVLEGERGEAAEVAPALLGALVTAGL